MSPTGDDPGLFGFRTFRRSLALVLAGAAVGCAVSLLITTRPWGPGVLGGMLLGAIVVTFFDVFARPLSSWIEKAVLAYLAFAFAASLGVPFVIFPVVSPGLVEDHLLVSVLVLVGSLMCVATLHYWATRLNVTVSGERDAGAEVAQGWSPYRWLWMAVGMVALAMVSWLDYLRTPGLSLDFLYLAPVFAVTWVAGRWGGVATAMVAMNAHGFAAAMAHQPGASAQLLLANALLLGAGLSVGALLLASVREHLLAEEAAARTDPLTGLMNRRAFLERVGEESTRSHRYGRPLTFSFIDLDGFKRVNDELGHSVGDRALQAVARVLRERSRASDIVARVGGDEFALLLPETDAEAAEAVLHDLRHRLILRMAAEQWPVTFSMGAVAGPSDGRPAEKLMEEADLVMYRVKHSGKNRVAVESRG